MEPPVKLTFTASDILKRSASEAMEWFMPFAVGATFPSDFNWNGLAESSTHHARDASSDADSLTWAVIAITIYGRLANSEPAASFDVSEMYCRIAMMIRHGARNDHEVLDPEVVLNWFRSVVLPLTTIDELLSRLHGEPWGSNVVDVVRPLRYLKNRLNVINLLADHHQIPEDIQLYRQFLDRLP